METLGTQKPKKTWKKIVLILVIVILTSAVASAIFVYTKLSKIKKYVPEATIAPQYETFDNEVEVTPNIIVPVIDPQTVVWPANVEVINDKDNINILLVGQDRRPNETRQRSDSMILVSYNMNTTAVNLISFMRDMYVQIPGYSDNRINAAYKFGGFELLDSTITLNFGVRIDGNFEVDFSGFASIVDVLGGIDMNLSDAEAEYLYQGKGLEVHTGLNHLNGEQTMEYSRIRYVGNSDYERTERQRNVLTLIIDKILALSNTEKLIVINAILPFLTTDMTKEQILIYSANVLNKGVGNINQYRIPADGAYSSATIRKMWVLVPDLEKNQELLSGLD